MQLQEMASRRELTERSAALDSRAFLQLKQGKAKEALGELDAGVEGHFRVDGGLGAGTYREAKSSGGAATESRLIR